MMLSDGPGLRASDASPGRQKCFSDEHVSYHRLPGQQCLDLWLKETSM